jgi:hypothetical protein
MSATPNKIINKNSLDFSLPDSKPVPAMKKATAATTAMQMLRSIIQSSTKNYQNYPSAAT